MARRRLTYAASLSLSLSAIGCGAGPASSVLRFEEVGAESGIALGGEAYGAAWGDVNGDGAPDLWVNGHRGTATLFVNQGEGRFADETARRFETPLRGDTHTASWVDFDADGDDDLFESHGADRGRSRGGNHLFVNEHGRLVDRAESWGVAQPAARGRHPLWFDFDRDGSLDLLLVNARRRDRQAPSTLYLRRGQRFAAAAEPFAERPVKLAMLADLREGAPLLVAIEEIFPGLVLELGSVPPMPIEERLGPKVGAVSDMAFADFDGDLRSDAYLATYTLGSEVALGGSGDVLSAALNALHGPTGIRFAAEAPLTLRVEPADLFAPKRVVLGAEGHHPERRGELDLSPHDPRLHGVPPADADPGLHVGYDPDGERWHVIHRREHGNAYVTVRSTAPLRELERIGFDRFEPRIRQRLLVNRRGRLRQDGPDVGFRGSLPSARGVVAGDFDNDMDVDLYLVASGPVRNAPNRLLRNDGGGRLVEIEGAAGAAGSTAGRGDTVAAADYDCDGDLDLFVTNEGGEAPFEDLGRHELFRNQTRGGHWLELDLVGTESPRDAIGARVVVEAAGRRQLRFQAGGLHRRAQDFRRLHFGLGESTAAATIVIEWPSGQVQRLRDVAADRILRVTEGDAAVQTVRCSAASTR